MFVSSVLEHSKIVYVKIYVLTDGRADGQI